MKDGTSTFVFKDPITDEGKRSKKGKLSLQLIDGKLQTITEGKGNLIEDVLVEVFHNGTLQVFQRFQDIRARAQIDTSNI